MAENFLYLTTTGRASGLPRGIEIWFALSTLAGTTSSRGAREESGWVKNLRNEPRVRFSVGTREAPRRRRLRPRKAGGESSPMTTPRTSFAPSAH